MTPEAEKAFCANYFPQESQPINRVEVPIQELNSQQIKATREIVKDYIKKVKSLAEKFERSF